MSVFIFSLAAVLLLLLAITYGCFRIGFYSPPRKPFDPDHIDLPVGAEYEPFRTSMENWAKEARAMPHEEVSITSFDGLTLRGTYYELAPGAPIELMFHGYRGSSERDLSGGVQRCFKVGRSALIVDQRAGGKSDGSIISFGINECRDCLSWVNFMVEHFGPDVKIILTGISMGAATVTMASDKGLPPNVIGILADCGYNSPKDIIKKVIAQDMKLPANLAYPFAKLAARIFGHFDLEETSSEEALKNCTVPVLFFHGEADGFVPAEMSRINYEACASRKRLVTIPGAGHGLSFPIDPERYIEAARDFFGPEGFYSGD